MKIVLASHNPGKIRELHILLAPLQLQVITQAELGVEEVEETGLSFVENALIKARHAAKITGLPAIADDSGLVVAALDGAPGIYSARYAGPSASSAQHIHQLLSNLQNVATENRQAEFHCVLVFMSRYDDPTPLICQGKWSGMILHEAKGTQGFGYDPVFYIPSLNKTAAELPMDLKNKISHRGIALQLLAQSLAEKSHDFSFMR